MREDEKILEKFGRETGFTVPEGYFDTLRIEVAERLPEYPVEREAPRLTTWQKIRPYVYMAAMFAGIWCMMKMFHTMSTAGEISFDNVPQSVALAMADIHSDGMNEVMTDLVDQELMDVMSSHYTTIDEFEADFGYTIDPQYADLEAK